MSKFKVLFALSVLCLLNPKTGLSQTIEGDWLLTARKCESAKNWEAIDNVTMSINLDTKTHSLRWVEAGCTISKIGFIEQIFADEVVFCKPKAHAAGQCSKSFVDHVNNVNAIESECTDNRKVTFSKDGNKMTFSETIQNLGFGCQIGEDLIYNFDRVL